MILTNGFIGTQIVSEVVHFSGSDNETNYNKNLETQPEDWYYRNIKISYNYNEYGHRSKSIKDLNLDNYILFLGCSHTEGVGLELEKTYPHLVSKHLGCDYYNLALGGFGIDVLEHNLVNWLYTIDKKPKHIVIQYPDHSRFISKYPGYPSMIPNGTWNSIQKNVAKFISSAEISGFFYGRKKVSVSLINNMTRDIPVIKINFGSIEEYDTGISYRRLDWARDFCHAGIKSHEKISELVLDRIK
jgi:hypothetical protein